MTIAPAPTNLLAELERETEVKSKKTFKYWTPLVNRESMNRWPVQGWSSGNGVGHCKLNAADLREEAAREYASVHHGPGVEMAPARLV